MLVEVDLIGHRQRRARRARRVNPSGTGEVGVHL